MYQRWIVLFLMLLCLLGNAGQSESILIGDVYLALGDSLAAGWGARPPQIKGYAPTFWQLLVQEKGASMLFVNLGHGHTTSWTIMLPGGQVDHALAILQSAKKNNQIVSPITIDIGANDLLAVISGSETEKEEALVRFSKNYDMILQKFREAAPEAEILTMTYYNPWPDSSEYETWLSRLNEVIQTTAALYDARVADVYLAFQGHIMEYTHMDVGNIHPTNLGHSVIARQYAAVSGF